ncbi:MAG: hypothetical protein EB090_04660 [Verrucomicrobia bacterium]|nr:hypothetical protein [Verrucomicrobiota bacterium]
MFRSGPPRRIQPSIPPANREGEKVPSPLPKKPWEKPVFLLGLGTASLLIAGSILLYLYTGSSFSKNDDEVRTPQVLQADYALWSASLRNLSKNAANQNAPAFPLLPPPAERKDSTLGLWNRWKNLPPEGLARAVLLRRLPQQVELTAIAPRCLTVTEDGVTVDYTVSLRAKEDILLVPVVPISLEKGLHPNQTRLYPKGIYAYDLPPGKVFDLAGQKTVFPAGSTMEGGWTLRHAEKSLGTWKATRADLLTLTRIPALESIFVREASQPPPALLRSQSELINSRDKQIATKQTIDSRLASISACGHGRWNRRHGWRR